MQLLYPIKAILMYFAILFAPADATKITITGFKDSEGIELVRAEGTWKTGANPVAVEGETFVVILPEGNEVVKIRDFAGLPGNHNWKKAPFFVLGEGTTLEKTATGFTLRRSAADGEANGIYQVVYGQPVADPVAQEELAVIAAPVVQGEITVNVFGAVKTPGAYKIPAGGSIVDALAAAGGWNKEANLGKISVIRGPAGEVPKLKIHDVNAILQGAGVAPALIQRDTILVPEKVF